MKTGDAKLKISLKDFLKIYTAISNKFIDEYFKFHELSDGIKCVIPIDDVIKYLEIKQKDEFLLRIRNSYIENIDYVKYTTGNKKTKNAISVRYYVNLETFEKICLDSRTKKANEIKNYFITLRKFIDYYKDHISNMILDNAARLNGKCVYIICANAQKDIFKIGKTGDIRKRLQTYATGRDKHPDIRFIMLVDNKECVETCVKTLLHSFRYRSNQEIYQVDIDKIKEAVMTCGIAQYRFDNMSKENIKSYIVFSDDLEPIKNIKDIK